MPLGRKKGRSPLAGEPAALRRERESLEQLRREVGARFEAVQRRELELQKLLTRTGPEDADPQPPAVGLDERERALDGREDELDGRAQDLNARTAELDAREHALAEREALVGGPEALEALRAEIDQRHAELAAAEQIFLRTRQELAERSDAVDARERDLLRRERDLDEREGVVMLPPLSDDEEEQASPRPARDDQPPFAHGIRELQRRGTRRERHSA